MSKISKKSFFNILKIAVFLFCFYIIGKNIFNEDKALEAIINFDYQYLIVIVFLSYILIFLQTRCIYNVILYTTDVKIKFTEWNQIFFNSQIFNMLITTSGFIYRAYKLKKFSMSLQNYININYFLAWFYLFFLLIFYSLEIYIFANSFTIYSYPPSYFLFLLTILIFIFPFCVLYIFPKNFKLGGSIIEWIYEKSLNILFFSKQSILNKKLLLMLVKFGLFSHFFQFLTMYLLIKALNYDVSLQFIIIFFVINSLFDQIPITPKNIGITEIAMAFVGMQGGLIFSQGLTIKLLLRIINALTILSVSLFFNIKNIK